MRLDYDRSIDLKFKPVFRGGPSERILKIRDNTISDSNFCKIQSISQNKNVL